MRPDPLPIVCERVRVQVSLELDGELSTLEKRMLDAHLVRCAMCRSYADDVSAFTEGLRAAPLERNARGVIVSLPRRMPFHRVQFGLAAAIVVAAVASVLQLGVPNASSTSTPEVTRFPTLTDGVREARQIAVDGREFEHHRGSVMVS